MIWEKILAECGFRHNAAVQETRTTLKKVQILYDGSNVARRDIHADDNKGEGITSIGLEDK